VDCGLIVEKGRGLKEKWLEYSMFELFSNRKWSWTRSMARWTVGGARSTVDRGQGLCGGSLEDDRNRAPVHGTSPQLRKKGEGMAVILTGCRRGRRRGRSDRATGEETTEQALGAGGAWAWREEKRGGERCGGGRRWSPFI
jgi:hypothetical protein